MLRRDEIRVCAQHRDTLLGSSLTSEPRHNWEGGGPVRLFEEKRRLVNLTSNKLLHLNSDPHETWSEKFSRTSCHMTIRLNYKTLKLGGMHCTKHVRVYVSAQKGY